VRASSAIESRPSGLRDAIHLATVHDAMDGACHGRGTGGLPLLRIGRDAGRSDGVSSRRMMRGTPIA